MVPELPAAERDTYIRQVSGTVGLAALAATVVRVAPALLLSLCSTEEGKAEPILGQLGKLERRVLWQLALAENWKRDQDAAKEAAKGNTAYSLNFDWNVLEEHQILCLTKEVPDLHSAMMPAIRLVMQTNPQSCAML